MNYNIKLQKCINNTFYKVFMEAFQDREKIGESKIELLSPTAPESPIAKFLEKKGEGIHHLAFGVKDIVASLAKLKAQGFRLIHETPIQGADQKLIAFVHPKDTTGALIELCEPLQQGL